MCRNQADGRFWTLDLETREGEEWNEERGTGTLENGDSEMA